MKHINGLQVYAKTTKHICLQFPETDTGNNWKVQSLSYYKLGGNLSRSGHAPVFLYKGTYHNRNTWRQALPPHAFIRNLVVLIGESMHIYREHILKKNFKDCFTHKCITAWKKIFWEDNNLQSSRMVPSRTLNFSVEKRVVWVSKWFHFQMMTISPFSLLLRLNILILTSNHYRINVWIPKIKHTNVIFRRTVSYLCKNGDIYFQKIINCEEKHRCVREYANKSELIGSVFMKSGVGGWQG